VDRDDGLQPGVLVVAEDDFFMTRVGDGFKNHWNGDSMDYGAGRHLQIGAMQPRLPRERETLKLIAPTEAGAMKLARSLVLRP
jgi:hypothetical protein